MFYCKLCCARCNKDEAKIGTKSKEKQRAKKQIQLNDSFFSCPTPPQKWSIRAFEPPTKRISDWNVTREACASTLSFVSWFMSASRTPSISFSLHIFPWKDATAQSLTMRTALDQIIPQTSGKYTTHINITMCKQTKNYPRFYTSASAFFSLASLNKIKVHRRNIHLFGE